MISPQNFSRSDLVLAWPERYTTETTPEQEPGKTESAAAKTTGKSSVLQYAGPETLLDEMTGSTGSWI